MRVLLIVGTRPEVIKMAPLVKELRSRPGIEAEVCSTGQHRDMLDQILGMFEIAPDVELSVMEENQTPSGVAARVLTGLDRTLVERRPDWVLVQGDTTTVMAASLAAAHRGIAVGHVEAGLRSYDRQNPFPEEMNRVITDHVASLLFAPTETARAQLIREGVAPSTVHVTGNTIVDALEWVISRPFEWERSTPLRESGLADVLRSSSQPQILVTAHRRENHGERLRSVCAALKSLAESGRFRIVFPVHRNPNVWRPVHEALDAVPNVYLLPPVDYLTLVHLFKRSWLALTDSGGIQEEAPTLRVPVLVLREVTERPEVVAVGAAKVIGTDTRRIVDEVDALWSDQSAWARMRSGINPFGDGFAARRIAEVLLTGRCREVRLQVV